MGDTIPLARPMEYIPLPRAMGEAMSPLLINEPSLRRMGDLERILVVPITLLSVVVSSGVVEELVVSVDGETDSWEPESCWLSLAEVSGATMAVFRRPGDSIPDRRILGDSIPELRRPGAIIPDPKIAVAWAAVATTVRMQKTCRWMRKENVNTSLETC